MTRPGIDRTLCGGLFVAAALMLWLGRVLLPHPIGTHFQPGDFAAVAESYHLWIWIYRVHIFGMVLTLMALTSLGSLATRGPETTLLWPGIAVAGAGMVVGAVGAAFYYHHGAWGAIETAGYDPGQLAAFVEALRVDTEYVTCLVRFGRVFFGLGLATLGAAIWIWRPVPRWLGPVAIVLGVAAMALTMGLPDDLHLYEPVFHGNAAWLLAVGLVALRR